MSFFNPFSWFGGDKKPSEKDILKGRQSSAWDSLADLSSMGVDTAKTAGDKGYAAQDDATKYFRALLGDNNLGETLSAPAINTTRDAADAAKREQAATGTGRSGGAVAANQSREADIMAQIASLLQGGDIAAMNLKNAAAGELAGIGAQDIQAMLQALGISVGASGALGEQSTSALNEKNRADAQKWASIIGGIADIASAGIAA